MIEVDVRGLSCPMPVIRTKKAYDENPGAELTVLVDSHTAKENVVLMTKKMGYSVDVEEISDGFKLLLKPEK